MPNGHKKGKAIKLPLVIRLETELIAVFILKIKKLKHWYSVVGTSFGTTFQYLCVVCTILYVVTYCKVRQYVGKYKITTLLFALRITKNVIFF